MATPEIGMRFGHLVVIDNNQRKGAHNLRACRCECDCGNIVIIPNADLCRGHSKSCGCRTGVLRTPHDSVKHESEARLYKIWANMLSRCYVPTSQAYCYYGGRGISVCEEWATDYQSFKRWAMESGYSDNLTIDRIDVNGNYEPSNCRWATWVEQQNNRRNCRFIAFNGKTQTMAMWAKELNMSPLSLQWRLDNGWSIERALTEPIHSNRRRKVV